MKKQPEASAREWSSQSLMLRVTNRPQDFANRLFQQPARAIPKQIRFIVPRCYFIAPLICLLSAGLCCAQFSQIQTIAGNSESTQPSVEGLAITTSVSNPFGIQPESDGSLVIASYDHHVIYRLDPKYQKLTLIAGNGFRALTGRDGDRPTTISMNQPHEIQVGSNGDIFIADTMNHRVGMVEKSTGRWKIVAGTGEAGFAGDNQPATQAKMNQAYSIAIDGHLLFVADLQNHRIREVDLSTGRIHTICGNGTKAMPSHEGLAVDQPLSGPRSLAVDRDNLWIVLREGNSVWRIDRHNNRIYHVAGTGEKGFSGDGGLAKDATFNGPKGIAIDFGRTVYVADTENHAIRAIDLQTNKISTVAGTGKAGYNGDGPEPATRQLRRPHGVCYLSRDGSLLIGDSENHRVRQLIP
ncbi:MAG: hypothetical protein KDB03_18075 [Planctomycetales bacterium]|nr:hypothetical protein [Planctomycetales bacterium]